ncbi:hypothetical protein [Nocardioides terrisoli]|uniref:hypothetical protein n=1 Tax=Nocardioides terrisoli TaxID=3388267 RepID=UPI00287B734A|nr:hypothetical protein [Nocardioides marmorisolisilvae]
MVRRAARDRRRRPGLGRRRRPESGWPYADPRPHSRPGARPERVTDARRGPLGIHLEPPRHAERRQLTDALSGPVTAPVTQLAERVAGA